MGDWVFGCDICQEVCPYNASVRGKPRGWPAFEPRPAIGTSPDLRQLLGLDDDGFRQTFRRSPIKRAKRRGLARNAAIALGNSGDEAAVPALTRAVAHDPEPLVRDAAAWALDRLAAADEPLGGHGG
jgi:epoxyqueuosine reductase